MAGALKKELTVENRQNLFSFRETRGGFVDYSLVVDDVRALDLRSRSTLPVQVRGG